MTREDIIRMARESEWLSKYDSSTGFSAEVAIRFAELVAAHEREKCAETVEKLLDETKNCFVTESAEHKLVKNISDQFKDGITSAIRARGEK